MAITLRCLYLDGVAKVTRASCLTETIGFTIAYCHLIALASIAHHHRIIQGLEWDGAGFQLGGKCPPGAPFPVSRTGDADSIGSGGV